MSGETQQGGSRGLVAVVTICVGDKYDWEYVQKLCNAVKRNFTHPYQFFCFTDKVRPLDGGEAILLPKIPGIRIWWWKTWIFSEACKMTARWGDMLWLDLDTVIVGSIDFFPGEKRFMILRDAYRNDHMQSSVMWIPRSMGDSIWREFNVTFQRRMHGDQNFIEWCFAKDRETHPRGWIQDEWPGKFVSFKAGDVGDDPGDASVVFFHGKPRPHQVKHQWVLDNWC